MADRQTRLRTPQSYRDTQVPVHRSESHIEQVLAQFGAEAISIQKVRRGDTGAAEVRFAYRGTVYRLRLELGDQPADHRQRMRVLFWHIKATLEAIVFGLVTADEALLPYAEIEDGRGRRTTVAEALLTDGRLPRATADEMLGLVGIRPLPAPAKGDTDA